MTGDSRQEAVNERVDRILTDPSVPALVEAFYETEGPFAGATFDTLGANPPDAFVSDDLLAVTLLDVIVKPPAFRCILGDDAALLGSLLRPVSANTDLWDASDADLDAAAAAWERLRGYGGIKKVTAGKLLARKRPRLIPIVDSVVEATIGAPNQRYWRSFRATLQDPDRRHSLAALRPHSLDDRVSLLRVLDVAIWMRHSNGTNAKRARRRAGCA